MDPLSVTGSIVAVLTAAEGTVRGLKLLRNFYNAIAKIDALINEIEDLRLVLADLNFNHTAEAAEQEVSSSHEVPGLSVLLARARQELAMLDTVMSHRLRPLNKASRVAWMREKSKIGHIQERLHVIKVNIVVLLVKQNTAQGFNTS